VTNLLVDIGNSSVKACFADALRLEEPHRYYGNDILEFISALCSNRETGVIAISSVRKLAASYFQPLESKCNKLVVVGPDTKLPLENKYSTPGTLGTDRLMASVAATSLFPGKDIIVFDFGTALTIDFITKEGEFSGGNISLGLSSRFKALNNYTQQLPLLEPPMKISGVGTSTNEAIESGIVLGAIFEVEGYINKYPNHIYIFTGGDAIYFAEKLKSSIFVVYNLVLMGLARVAEDYAKNI
jgi:type III pantothenate kinase